MSRHLAVAAAFVLAAAGCAPTAVLESGGPADAVAMLPGGAGLAAAADSAYRYEASAGFFTMDDEQPAGDVAAWTLGFACYFLDAVENDEVPIGLQPLDQRASRVGFTFGLGDYDYETGGTPDSDVSEWEVSARFVLGEATPADGLGFDLSFGRRTMENYLGGPDDLVYTNVHAGALYYIPLAGGLAGAVIPKLGYSNTDTEVGANDSDLGGVDIGVEFYSEIVSGQYIGAEFAVGFWEYESGSNDVDVTDIGVRVDYYPLKVLGVGIDWGGQDWDTAAPQDEDRFGVHASVSFDGWGVPGLDLNISWENREQDNGDEEDVITLTVDYRF